MYQNVEGSTKQWTNISQMTNDVTKSGMGRRPIQSAKQPNRVQCNKAETSSI